jgi:hypothetical protein
MGREKVQILQQRSEGMNKSSLRELKDVLDEVDSIRQVLMHAIKVTKEFLVKVEGRAINFMGKGENVSLALEQSTMKPARKAAKPAVSDEDSQAKHPSPITDAPTDTDEVGDDSADSIDGSGGTEGGLKKPYIKNWKLHIFKALKGKELYIDGILDALRALKVIAYRGATEKAYWRGRVKHVLYGLEDEGLVKQAHAGRGAPWSWCGGIVM